MKHQIKIDDIGLQNALKIRRDLAIGTTEDASAKTLEADLMGNFYVVINSQDVLTTRSLQKAVAIYNSH